jgi:hypothetical protein
LSAEKKVFGFIPELRTHFHPKPTIVSDKFGILLPTMLTQYWHKTTWGSQTWHFVLCRELHPDNKCLSSLHQYPIE